jgi:hypothetical protein
VASVGNVQISGSRPRKIKAQVRALEQDVEPELVSEQLSELRDVAESRATSRIPTSLTRGLLHDADQLLVDELVHPVRA